ncbi:hypothetical protein B0T26DRAFT_720323 [Lasiosphaeria miniovina]|uniref:Uncharacterized protein n=1 Tax=Lasiosphaeria miniovina TaxID=1954250 RepID=A0AA40A4C2_9PEZI|nr:uncharacterized protein B0T26DRAFT_720323 [Lasiosphaeria miniovina]KAK0709061.1 hypothetical protein B0T26DRAFT_720323 [Lasiosphaeria miniovina]
MLSRQGPGAETKREPEDSMKERREEASVRAGGFASQRSRAVEQQLRRAEELGVLVVLLWQARPVAS